jgi:hypothetical protein
MMSLMYSTAEACLISCYLSFFPSVSEAYKKLSPLVTVITSSNFKYSFSHGYCYDDKTFCSVRGSGRRPEQWVRIGAATALGASFPPDLPERKAELLGSNGSILSLVGLHNTVRIDF